MPKPTPPVRRPGDEHLLRRSHPTAVAFLDESGVILQDQFFGVGVLKMQEPSRILRQMQKIRDRQHFYGEFKFYELTAGSLDLGKQLAALALGTSQAELFCFISDRSIADPIERFGTPWAAYAKLAEQLVTSCVHNDGELLSVLADNYSTPDTILFEEELKRSVNGRQSRLAVTSVCRLDSRSCDGLQLADLLISAIVYEFRKPADAESPKAQLAEYVRSLLGTDTCLSGFRTPQHSIAIYEHGSWTPPPPRRSVTRRRLAGPAS